MSGSLRWSLWSLVAAWGTYFCMYGFRKPFTTASFSDMEVWGMDYKMLLIMAQMLGYAISKFLGIKLVTQATSEQRVPMLLGLIAIAELALLLFGLTPAPWNLFWLFCNGVPLGMVLGLVLGFLEGRQQTEALVAGLCTSFIIADGATKSVGAGLLEMGVPEFWMPAVTGGIFAPPLLFFAWMLTRIPQPSCQDVDARSARSPMSSDDRWTFFRRYAIGISLLVLIYALTTIVRGIRADFAPEIWASLRRDVSPSLFAWSELAVAVGTLVLCGSIVLIKNHQLAFFLSLTVALGGTALVIASLVAQHMGALSSFAFMVLLGIGLYLPYIVIHTTIFERLLAMTRERGNVTFPLILADSFGYLGYFLVLLGWNAMAREDNFLTCFLVMNWVAAISCLILLILCWRYFASLVAGQATPQDSIENLREVPEPAVIEDCETPDPSLPVLT